jgi:hypothetical protein
VIGHALTFGSSPLGTLLVQAMATAADRKIVRNWLVGFGPFVADGDDLVFSKKKRDSEQGPFADVRTADEITRYLDGLNDDAVPQWWEAKTTQARAKPPMDLDDLVSKLIKRVKREHAAGDEPVEHIGLLSYIEHAVAKYHGDMTLARAAEEQRAKEAATDPQEEPQGA